jgi:hypothetical protein
VSPEAAKRPPETPNEAAQATLISQIAAHWKKFRLGNELIFSWLKMQRLDQRFPKRGWIQLPLRIVGEIGGKPEDRDYCGGSQEVSKRSWR